MDSKNYKIIDKVQIEKLKQFDVFTQLASNLLYCVLYTTESDLCTIRLKDNQIDHWKLGGYVNLTNLKMKLVGE